MTDQRQWYAGVDWASESHHVFLTDGDGRTIGERVFQHGGEGLAEMAAWLMARSGAAEGTQIQVAIELPHGPVVETLLERGLKVHAINPKQMDRCRDRFTLVGAKDDSRDAEVISRSGSGRLRGSFVIGTKIRAGRCIFSFLILRFSQSRSTLTLTSFPTYPSTR